MQELIQEPKEMLWKKPIEEQLQPLNGHGTTIETFFLGFSL